MANASAEHLPTTIEEVDDLRPSTCSICSEFGSEECDVLQDLGRYRATEASILEAIEADGAEASPTA
jgi:hypothetical protein